MLATKGRIFKCLRSKIQQSHITYGLCLGTLFKKLIGKQSSSRKEIMERVHRYMKQEEAASKKYKTNQGEKLIEHPMLEATYWKIQGTKV